MHRFMQVVRSLSSWAGSIYRSARGARSSFGGDVCQRILRILKRPGKTAFSHVSALFRVLQNRSGLSVPIGSLIRRLQSLFRRATLSGESPLAPGTAAQANYNRRGPSSHRRINGIAYSSDYGARIPPSITSNELRTFRIRKIPVDLTWLVGTVLTALVGVALLAGGLAAANREGMKPTQFKSIEDIRGTGNGVTSHLRGHRLSEVRTLNESMRVVRLREERMTSGRLDIIHRPVTVVRASIPLVATDRTRSITPFSSERFMTVNPSEENEPPQPTVILTDPAISIAYRTFPVDLDFTGAPDDPDEEAMMRSALTRTTEAESAAYFSASKKRFVRGRDVDPLTSVRATSARRFASDEDLFSEFKVTEEPFKISVLVQPENITRVFRTPSEGRPEGRRVREDMSLAAYGGSLHLTLNALGINERESQLMIRALERVYPLVNLTDQHLLRLIYRETGPAIDDRLALAASVMRDGEVLGSIALDDAGNFRAVDAAEPLLNADPHPELVDLSAAPSLFRGIHEIILRKGLPAELADQLVRLFVFELEFSEQVRPGDYLEILLSDEIPLAAKLASQPSLQVLFAKIRQGDREVSLFRETSEVGSVKYFSSDGQSSRNFLLRKPLAAGVYRSGFGPRRHPVLGYVRRHTGVDWAARRGTPVFASGDGTITRIQNTSGYGNYIRIRHVNGFESGYAHMAGFAPGLRSGSKVRQGQTIGYVGSTGLSTGPHLHYELLINGSFVDPLRAKIPKGERLTGNRFKTFRSQVRSILETIETSIPPSMDG